jgi:hypothetical protein
MDNSVCLRATIFQNPEGTMWTHGIKMDLGEGGWSVRDWVDLAQDRDHRRALVNTVMNLRVPFLSSCATGGFS